MAAMSILKIVSSNIARNGFISTRQTVSKLPITRQEALRIVVRQMSGGHAETMKIRPSRWSWNRFKDMLHFYFLLGIIPLTVFTTCINIFVGPARLVDIPEGYVPEEHELYQHPVTRWISRNIVRSYQMEYEMYCQHVFEEEYKKNLRLAEKAIRAKMYENQDVQAWYYQPNSSRYYKAVSEGQQRRILSGGSN
nr:EOG090X0FIE [Chydorus sphaericus]